MILKDLRISPLRNILTGISMFVGIIAMISSVLVGTLGKEYLLVVLCADEPAQPVINSGTLNH